MVTVFPQLAEARIEHLWGGIMEVPLNRAPVIGPWRGEARTRVWQAQGFGGHGVAFTGMAGRIVAVFVSVGQSVAKGAPLATH